MNRLFSKKKRYFLLPFLLVLSMFFLRPAGEAAATGTTPGFAISSTPFRFLGGFLSGWHWGLEYWSEAADHDLIASARASGMTVIHIMLPQFETSLGSYDEAKLQKLDHFLDAAYNANVYVMPSFIQAYGEVTLDPSNPYYHERGIEGIIKDPTLRGGLTLRQHFRNRIAALLNRTNTVNLRKYKDDPTIMAWIVCDEPISAPFNYPNGAPQITLEELTDWFQEAASFIKSVDSNHLVTVWSQPAIQEFFGWTLGYLQALGIPEFDFMYTEDAGLRIVAGLVQGYNCTGQTPQYMLDQFLPGKPVAFHPAFTSGCWDTNVICTDNFTTQAANLNLAVPEYFEVGGNAVFIQNWGTDLYSSLPTFAQCYTYTDSVMPIVNVAQTHSELVNPEGYPAGPLQFVNVIYGLNVSKSGSGSGTVTSNPTGISCGTQCSKVLTQGSVVVLAAQADAGSTFTGWSGGGCSGTGTCEVTMNAEITVTAAFNLIGSTHELSVEKSGSGSGTVTSNPVGISCGSDCTQAYSEGQSVTLTAAADPGSIFGGWSDGCSGTGSCEVTMNADTIVTATFALTNVPPEISPNEGTIGTQIIITGSGFGTKKGKVLINGIPAKIAKDGWGLTQITCSINKPPFPVDTGHPVSVVVNRVPIPVDGTFTLKAPVVDDLLDSSGVYSDPIRITGLFFGTKRGKVYLYDPVTDKKKNLKVTDWKMFESTGVSELTFVVSKPSKAFPAGTYQLKVFNKVGTATASTNFTLEPLPLP